MRILRRHQVQEMIGLSATSIYRLEAAGLFPRRIRLSGNSVGWRSDEIQDWIDSRQREGADPPKEALAARASK